MFMYNCNYFAIIYGISYGDQLPEHTEFEFNYNDILARSFYYLEKSLKNKIELKNVHESMRDFTTDRISLKIYLS